MPAINQSINQSIEAALVAELRYFKVNDSQSVTAGLDDDVRI